MTLKRVSDYMTAKLPKSYVFFSEFYSAYFVLYIVGGAGEGQ